jgi:dihydroorotate dehydrogenase (NAD+) catalytic subunit
VVADAVTLAPQRERGLTLRNPLIAGPGTVSFGRDAARLLPLDQLGAVITTTTTLHPRAGHSQPRLIETPAGLLMSTGLQNPGLRTMLSRYSPAWGRLHAPVILSLAAEDAKTFAYCAEVAQDEETIAGLELEPDLLQGKTDMVRVVDVMRGITSLPLLVHVPAGQPQTVADAIVDLSAVGCDAVIVGSPWPGLVMDQATRKPQLAGGVWGPAIRPLALRLVYDAVKLLGPEHVPLVAAGGISSAEDVSAFLAAGANAVMLDTVMYVDPAAVGEMVGR